MNEIHVVSWDEVEDACSKLASQIKQKGDPRICRTSGIIAIARGGLVPAALLAYKLKLDIFGTACIPALNSSQRNDLLIVDDICDTGRTFTQLLRSFPNAVYVSTYVKPKGKPMCEYWSHEVAQDTWVVFPWAPDDEVNR
jgi:xanthine phosphoribosyltransferase